MAKGILNIQAADGAVIGLHVPDGLTSGERQIALGANLSGAQPYHLLQGNLAVSNSTITQGFNTTLWTGNGATQSITTGIDMNTQYGNTPEERFGGLIWGKSRSLANQHQLYDTVRGATKAIYTALTNAEATVATGLTAFTSTGVTLGSDAGLNTNASTNVGWNFQTTHRVSGTTNHGQAYTCHYNPFTGFTIVKYTGSGIAGHEIPHMLGRKLGFAVVKSTTSVTNWRAYVEALGLTNSLYLSTTAAMFASTDWSSTTETTLGLNTGAEVNASGTTYIMYGWANSYFDESNKLIGNYELVTYQASGASGFKIHTKAKCAWVVFKRVDSTSNWQTIDNKRVSGANDGILWANLSDAETIATDYVTFVSDGIILNNAGASDNNVSGGTYIALVAYDTNANGGGSYYPLASDTANVQVNNALIPIAQGIDSNGAKNTILSKNETFSGVTYTQGKNYPYYDALGNRGVSVHKPRYLESELVRTYAGESPDYFNVKENKWYSTNSGSELVTNGTFSSGVTTGWTGNGATLSVVNGTLKVSNGATQYAYAYQGINTVIGKTYKVFVDCIAGVYSSPYCFISSSVNASGSVSVYNNILGNSYDGTYTGKKVITFVAQTTTSYLYVGLPTTITNLDVYFDNISVFASDIVQTTEITESRNYMNHIVYADNDGGVLYVEELPKIEYKDIIKANEFKGKNACTAWANVSSSVILLDNYNFSAVTFKSGNAYKLYFKEPMDNTNYVVVGAQNETYINTTDGGGFAVFNKTLTSFEYICPSNTYNTNNHILVFGGKN